MKTNLDWEQCIRHDSQGRRCPNTSRNFYQSEEYRYGICARHFGLRKAEHHLEVDPRTVAVMSVMES